MGHNTSVSLGNHFESFIENTISEGRFKNASEVIRAGLRLLEDEESKRQFLIKALKEGEDSGFVENFDSKEHLKMLHAKHVKHEI